MAHTIRDPRTKPVPEDLRSFARELVNELGPRGAAQKLNVGRSTVLSIIAGQDAMPGTIALLREAKAGRSAA
jgi:hypothetical protein